jgi:hypothetical protein
VNGDLNGEANGVLDGGARIGAETWEAGLERSIINMQ